MAVAVQSVPERATRSFNPGLAGLVLLVVLWMLTAIYSGSFLPLLLVTDSSMEPAFQKGDIVLVKSVLFSDIAQGDVVAFNFADPLSDGPSARMLRRVADIGILSGKLVLATMKENGAVDGFAVSPEQVNGVAVLRVRAIGWPLTLFDDDRNASLISLGVLLGLLTLSALVVLYRRVPRHSKPAASQTTDSHHAPPLAQRDDSPEDKGPGDERDELRETISRLSQKIGEIEARHTGEFPKPQAVESSKSPAPDNEGDPTKPPQESPDSEAIVIDAAPLSDLLREPEPPAVQEAAQPQEQDAPEKVEPPDETPMPETPKRASRPARGQQAFVTLSDQELAGLDIEPPDAQSATNDEPIPMGEAFSERHVDIDLEPPSIQLFDEYRRAIESMGGSGPVSFDESGGDDLERVVSLIIDAEMPIHIDALRTEITGHYGVRGDDATLQLKLDEVIESLVSQERAAWEQVDGSRTVRGQFLNNPVLVSSIVARRPRQNEPQRGIRRIALSELQAGVSSVMWAMYTGSRSALIAETARQFGYDNLDGAMHDRIRLAIDGMIRDGRLLDKSGGLTLKE